MEILAPRDARFKRLHIVADVSVHQRTVRAQTDISNVGSSSGSVVPVLTDREVVAKMRVTVKCTVIFVVRDRFAKNAANYELALTAQARVGRYEMTRVLITEWIL